MSEFYDRQGHPLNLHQWGALHENDAYRTVSCTDINSDVRVSTVWLGINHGTSVRPLIFETMVFGGDHDGYMWRYETEQQAILSHEEIVSTLTQFDQITEMEIEKELARIRAKYMGV